MGAAEIDCPKLLQKGGLHQKYFGDKLYTRGLEFRCTRNCDFDVLFLGLRQVRPGDGFFLHTTVVWVSLYHFHVRSDPFNVGASENR